MKHLRNLIGICLGLCVLLFPPSALAEKVYSGADSGYLVYSIGSIAHPLNFSLEYRKIPKDARPKWKGSMYCDCVRMHWSKPGTFPDNADYSGHDSGFVIVEKLPPGQYEIYDWGIVGSTGVSTINWSSRVKFSIPFTVEAGKATYIGNFERGCWCERVRATIADNLGYFVVSDKSERDLAIARTKEPALPEVSNQVWDVSQLNSPVFFTSEPE